MKLIHGGDLNRANQDFGFRESWIDLSTGISPYSWPIPSLPERLWSALPTGEHQLIETAAKYYDCNAQHLLPVPGSQTAIQLLPTLVDTASIALPNWGYAEHLLAWQQAGHQIHRYKNIDELEQLVFNTSIKFAVVINPNNPSADFINCEIHDHKNNQLNRIIERLRQRHGWLLIDEAFMDATPQYSMMPQCSKPGLVILRSLGKFFGLAGVRIGFVAGPESLLESLAQRIPLWSLSHPAIWIAQKALADAAWHKQQVNRLAKSAIEWSNWLEQNLPEFDWRRTPLFVTGFGNTSSCNRLYQSLGYQGILIRLFQEAFGSAAIRFGLPGDDTITNVKNTINKL